MSSKKKVLVVDDDEGTLLLIRTLLEGEGYAVLAAKDAVTAMVLAQRQLPDLIIMDIGLPGGDGLSVLRRLRTLAHHHVTPVIVVTGKEGGVWRRRAEQAGASHFMSKPVEKDDLLAHIDIFLPSGHRPEGVIRCPHCGHDIPLYSEGSETSP